MQSGDGTTECLVSWGQGSQHQLQGCQGQNVERKLQKDRDLLSVFVGNISIDVFGLLTVFVSVPVHSEFEPFSCDEIAVAASS